jgi:broad specificity phosphatase PhoE
MPVILLVRHGQASFGEADYDRLSELGRRQSQVVGQELVRRGLRDPVVACGTLLRQRDTATIALAEAGLSVEPLMDPRWNEYDHGDLLQHLQAAPGKAPPASSRDVQVLLDAALATWVGEGSDQGWGAFSGGARSALEELIRAIGPGRDGIVFTSGGVVAAICAGLLDGSANSVVALNRMAINSSITKLIAGSAGISLASFNEHAHLEPHEVTYR